MNILLVNHYAGSVDMGMEFRPYYLAREWVKMGHNVTIVAGDFSHLRKNNPEVTRDFQEQNIEGIKYCWLKTGAYHGNGAARALTMFRFVRKLWFNAQYLVDRYKPDIVIASSTYPIDTFACQRIARLVHAKLIHEVHDMWPATLIEVGGMSRKHPFVQLMQWGENSFCRNSDAVVSLLPNAKEYFMAHGMKKENFYCVPNGFDIKEWEQDQAKLPQNYVDLLTDLKNQGKFILGYAGGHAISNALIYLLKALEHINNENIAVVLVGKGVEKENLQRYANKYCLENVYFLPAVDKVCIPTLLSHMDALYIGWSKRDLYMNFGISPNKLIDYMLSEKPILFSGNVANDIVRESGCGLSVEAENADEISKGIDYLAAQSIDDLKDMGRVGREFAINTYDYRILANRFIEIMELISK